MKDIRINNNRYIGENEPAFIIAEAGSNHNNNKKLAMELIDAAADAGADAIKFQLFKADLHYSKKTPKHSYYSENLYDLIKKLEMPREWVFELKEHCDKKNIIFSATPSDEEALKLLESIDTSFQKVASFEIVDLDLLTKIAQTNRPTIISTGLCNMEEIEDAYKVFIKNGNDKIIFLQCASVYPSNVEIMNLKAMNTIKNSFNVITGLSDHTLGTHISVAAVAMGAKVIEKHFTLDKNLEGPDHPFAIEPNELTKMISNIRDVEKSFGDGVKLGPSLAEMEFYEKARRSIHAKHNIKKGQIINEEDLVMKRPGYGIKPKYINIVVGRKAKCDIEQDQWIQWDMI